MEFNTIPLETFCASLCEIMGIAPPATAEKPTEILTEYAKSVFGNEAADRIFMYNPDAIGQWIYEKYHKTVSFVKEICDIEIPFKTVMPSVTPVCFGTMYTGAPPSVHGIEAYVKPVIKIETIFDAMIKVGKKCAVVATAGDSMSKIYLEREMDYYFYPTVSEVNEKAEELIKADGHDFIAVYNGNYDSTMHKTGPESEEALLSLSENAEAFSRFNDLIKENWKKHNTLLGFAMDHGCHEIDGSSGSHGLYMPEDINILHSYKAYKSE